MSRSKFKEHKSKQSVFSKTRKALLNLFEKGVDTYQILLNQTKGISPSGPSPEIEIRKKTVVMEEYFNYVTRTQRL